MRVFVRILVGGMLLAAFSSCNDGGKGIETANYPTMDNMLEVDSDNLRVIRVDDNGDKASIAIGETDTRWCDITVDSEVLASGAGGGTTLDGSGEGLSAECQWDSDYYVESTEHPTSVAFNLTGKKITADFLLVNSATGSYLALTGVGLRLP